MDEQVKWKNQIPQTMCKTSNRKSGRLFFYMNVGVGTEQRMAEMVLTCNVEQAVQASATHGRGMLHWVSEVSCVSPSISLSGTTDTPSHCFSESHLTLCLCDMASTWSFSCFSVFLFCFQVGFFSFLDLNAGKPKFLNPHSL